MDKRILSEILFAGIILVVLFLIGGMYEDLFFIVNWIIKLLPLIVLGYVLYRIDNHLVQKEIELNRLAIHSNACEEAFKLYFGKNSKYRYYSYKNYLMECPLTLRFYIFKRPPEVKQLNKLLVQKINDPHERMKVEGKIKENERRRLERELRDDNL